MSKWPRDNQQELIAFYGNPATGEVGRQLVRVTPPFKMYYEGKPIAGIQFHKKAAGALLAALNQIWEHYNKDQTVIDKLGISKYNGSYNPRKVRGSNTKWSNHAFGAAIDINAEQNGFNVAGNIPQPVIDAFKAQGASWGGDYTHRKDPMHFEFCQTTAPSTVGIADIQADGDTDDDTPEVQAAPVPSVDESPEFKPPTFWEKFKNWFLTGGLGTLGVGGGMFSGIDWRIVALIAGVGLVVFLIVWFVPRRQ